MTGSPDQGHETQNFVKNLGIMAGLLVLSKKSNSLYSTLTNIVLMKATVLCTMKRIKHNKYTLFLESTKSKTIAPDNMKLAINTPI